MGGAARAALGVSAARLRAQPLRPLLVVFGVGLAFAMTVAIVGGSLVARQQALHRAIADVPDSSQGFRVDRFGTPLSDRTYAREDQAVQRVLGTLSAGVPRRIVFFRQLRIAGRLVEVTAVDRLSGIVKLRSGRLPRTCTPSRCEVLQIGTNGQAQFHEGVVKLDRVGIAELRDPNMFGYVSAAASSPTAPPALVLGPGIVGARAPSVAAAVLSRLLVALPLARRQPAHLGHQADARGGVAGAERPVRGRLGVPAEQPRRRSCSTRAGAARSPPAGSMLVGGETSALLLGFAIIAAIGLRRGLGAERRRLLARGARRWQAWLTLAAEVGAMTLAGALLGIAAGSAVVAAIAGAASQPAGAILGAHPPVGLDARRAGRRRDRRHPRPGGDHADG